MCPGRHPSTECLKTANTPCRSSIEMSVWQLGYKLWCKTGWGSRVLHTCAGAPPSCLSSSGATHAGAPFSHRACRGKQEPNKQKLARPAPSSRQLRKWRCSLNANESRVTQAAASSSTAAWECVVQVAGPRMAINDHSGALAARLVGGLVLEVGRLGVELLGAVVPVAARVGKVRLPRRVLGAAAAARLPRHSVPSCSGTGVGDQRLKLQVAECASQAAFLGTAAAVQRHAP